MEQKLTDLEPKKVFEFFDELTRIPRGSGNETAVSDYLVDFADRRGLIAYRDEWNNVTILKPATTGMEEKETVILQAHMDMVCIAEEGKDIDFTKDPIEAYVDGDFVRARGTTLGADDGIGVALILSVLDSDEISHPMIEAVFTADEEEGLNGANGYDASRLKGKRLINIDTEEENHIVTGCAGGCRCDVASKCKNTKVEGNIYEIGIHGLAGGHSGTDIDKGSANANVLMGRFFDGLDGDIELSIGSYSGGIKDNAICSAANATVVVKKKHCKSFEKYVKAFCEEIIAEYDATDPGFRFRCKDKGKGKLEVMSTKDMTRFVALLNVLPCGVVKMSQTADIVETSANLGVVSAKPKSFSICVSLRSNRDASLDWIISKVKKLAEAFSAQFTCRDSYPAWDRAGGSDLAKSAEDLYRKMFDRDIETVKIHAGLECAIFTKKIKYVDAISIGPDMFNVHSPAECLSISSTAREMRFLVELLKL